MNEAQPRKRPIQFRVRTIFLLVALVAFVTTAVIYIDYWWPLGTAKYAVQRRDCQQNLEQVWDALNQFVSAHGDLPRDAHGSFSLEPLFDGESPILQDRGVLQCPGRWYTDHHPSSDYITVPHLTVDHLNAGEIDNAFPIVFDRPGAHEGDPHNPSVSPSALLSDGRIISMYCDNAHEYEVWANAYSSGISGVSTFPMRSED